MMEEDPAHLDADGYHLFGEQQQHLFLIPLESSPARRGSRTGRSGSRQLRCVFAFAAPGLPGGVGARAAPVDTARGRGEPGLERGEHATTRSEVLAASKNARRRRPRALAAVVQVAEHRVAERLGVG